MANMQMVGIIADALGANESTVLDISASHDGAWAVTCDMGRGNDTTSVDLAWGDDAWDVASYIREAAEYLRAEAEITSTSPTSMLVLVTRA